LIPHPAARDDGHAQFRSPKTPILHDVLIAWFRLFGNPGLPRDFPQFPVAIQFAEEILKDSPPARVMLAEPNINKHIKDML